MKGTHMAKFGQENRDRIARGEKPLKRSEYFKKKEEVKEEVKEVTQ